MRVLGFGDNIVDRFVDRGVEYPGGNCVNVAVYAGQLGAEAAYLGVFGDDDGGAFVRSCIEAAGVDTSRCEVRRGPNGLTEIQTVRGERHFLRWNGGGVTATDPIRLVDPDYVAGFDLVHSSVYSSIEPELHALRATKVLVTYDFSSEPAHRTDEYLARVCPLVDLALVSCADWEQQRVWSELRRFSSQGAALVLGTMGANGAVLFDGASFYHSNAAPASAPIVDTMGCGDAYLAAFAVEMLAVGWKRSMLPPGPAVHRAMKQAARFAAGQCSVEGAFGYGREVVPQPAA
ncbi:PfkB family carbohydrate kinase [Arthrobacter sp. SLBN-112]|uniref:PfkB family carbohydrate kinase n=1 Tax=Arthrobacter sp. SLBN-112 TaxID=2768452 RepID=UPI0027B0FEF3|nr:PfkB family carbohydrate kinase [Arthrobacter sp. SLBN-112]MDQ0802143.1 fructoselysine 6-kinase [Arthrobacter sp. SLBN-112]